MKAQHWLPVAVFLGVSIPIVVLLNALDMGGEYRVWVALGAGALATAVVQSKLKLKSRGEQE